jgi:integrase/recombinase XerD
LANWGAAVSALAEHAARYIALRRSLGFKMSEPSRVLEDLVAFVNRAGQEHLSVAGVLNWAEPARTPGAYARRLSVARRFAQYLAVFDSQSEVPSPRLCSTGQSRRAPYIYTPGEVAALMRAAQDLEGELWASSVSTLIGLCAATGARPGEAYRLRVGDIDLDISTLSVMQSKGGRSRLLPLHTSTVGALGRHLRIRARQHLGHDNLFVSSPGRPLRSGDFSRTFRELCQEVGIGTAPGGSPARLGDLRHSFAVSTLVDWHRGGADVACLLPVLSAYLGHLRPANTYWYLQAVPELMALAAERLGETWEAAP